MRKSNIVFFLIIFYTICITGEKDLWAQAMFEIPNSHNSTKYITLFINGISLELPLDMYIITNNYHTEGVERYFAVVPSNEKLIIIRPSISRIRDRLKKENCILFAQSVGLVIEILSYPCDDDNNFEVTRVDESRFFTIIEWIIKKGEEKVIELMKPTNRRSFKNIGIVTIEKNTFFHFIESYGGSVLDRYYYCVKFNGSLFVLRCSFYEGNSDALKQVLESIVFSYSQTN